ncbi:hypothetical protein [Nannocystis pusilla]|uniref:hypothetical protein n=1 Tax=Nannocystis pusilla TaxID=889268 RepID=UPI003B81D5E9
MAISARVTPDPSQIGDLLELEVTVAYPAGFAVNVPLGLKLDPLHLVSVEESEPESTGQGLRKVFTFTIQHFGVGEAKTPAFPITYVAPDGAVQTAQVPSHNFSVTALLANEAEPKRQGEDPPISLEYPNNTAETAIYFTAGALVAGFVSALCGCAGADGRAPSSCRRPSRPTAWPCARSTACARPTTPVAASSSCTTSCSPRSSRATSRVASASTRSSAPPTSCGPPCSAPRPRSPRSSRPR